MQLLAKQMWSGTQPDGETHTYHYGNVADLPDDVAAEMLELYPEHFEVVALDSELAPEAPAEPESETETEPTPDEPAVVEADAEPDAKPAKKSKGK